MQDTSDSDLLTNFIFIALHLEHFDDVDVLLSQSRVKSGQKSDEPPPAKYSLPDLALSLAH